MSDLGDMARQAGLPWCDPDDCPPAICGGPHREVRTSFGIEILRYDQEPVGTPVSAPPPRPFYPDCSGCGHNSSGVVANQCTAFVPYPEDDPRGHAGMCSHRCTDDPAVRAWLEHR